jgi:hypothetical protein
MVAEKASALIAADAASSDAAPSRTAPSLDLRQVLGRLPHPRKPSRSTVQENR